MASSSTSSVRKSFKYDVFLSFRGEDTRKNFTDHLYHALNEKGINTYKDDVAIRQGNVISDELIQSIEDSRFYIIVFSKGYASSSWCLDELVKIMECQKRSEHTAYPVFYDVEPSEVRWQDGAVGEAFSNLKNDEAAPKWKEALSGAADLAGRELKKTANGHEAEFIRIIIEDISKYLQSNNSCIDEKLVGMKTRVENVISYLKTDIDIDGVTMIGIKGIGGGGKTTLARVVYDQISYKFDGISFIENVREETKVRGLASLQKKILKNVLKDQKIKVSGVSDGINMMRMRMSSTKVLLVLDDVDNIDQLNALAGDRSWFKKGSRIIITTRDENVLLAHGVNWVHNVNLLSRDEAICLFSRLAFKRDVLIQGYEDLSRQVVAYASGLPLTITVLGSHLCDKDLDEWKDALERLKTIPLEKTLQKLELSFLSLPEDRKNIFLNVACILKGWEKDLAIEALESCGLHAKIGLKDLQQKSLITIYYDSYYEHQCVGMHDHLEEMGKNIVRRKYPEEPEKHIRLWLSKEIEDILAHDLGTRATQYMRLDLKEVNLEIVMKGIRKMQKLRFLHVYFGQRIVYSGERIVYSGQQKSELDSQYLPNALQYLHWYGYPFRCLPNTFQGDNLVVLKMNRSKILRLWEGEEKKVLSKLKVLDLSNSDLTIFDLGLIPNVEVLNLGGCPDLVQFHTHHGRLKLKYLNLRFSKLETVDLHSALDLEMLYLEGCHDLVRLNMPGKCQNLRSLELTASKLTVLNLGQTPNLEHLNLNNCYNLEELLMAEKCEKLVSLDISYSKLKTFDLGLTPNIMRLDLEDCDNLVRLHVPVGCLENIDHLVLSGCLRFTYFHYEKKRMGSTYDYCEVDQSLGLHHLIAERHERCPLHPESTLPKFQFECFYKDGSSLTRNLETLISAGLCAYTNLETVLGSICELHLLIKLKLEYHPEAPKNLSQLECLEELIFSNTNMKHLPDGICRLKHLKILQLQSCWRLEKLPDDVGGLECLKSLTLSSGEIKHLPDSICKLKHLIHLQFLDCFQLENLPKDLGQLECLERLYLSHTKIKHLPDSLCKLKTLKTLTLLGGSLLESLPKNFGQLKCLTYLVLSSSKIKHLPDTFCMLKDLENLDLHRCSSLEKLPEDLDRLECLLCLKLFECKSLQDIPISICKMKHLQSLDVTGTCISHLPGNICSMKGLAIKGSRGLLESCGFTSEIEPIYLNDEYEDDCWVMV